MCIRDSRADTVGNAVGNVERLDLKGANLEYFARAEGDQLHFVQLARLAQLGLDQPLSLIHI